jgi:flagellar protein FlaF
VNSSKTAARAYRAAAESRSLREQEADVFRHASTVLRTARGAGPIAQARAVADNRRLWSLVTILVRDVDNQLPAPVRGQIASLGLAVQRELEAAEPDFDFVIGINEHIAAGLSGQP